MNVPKRKEKLISPPEKLKCSRCNCNLEMIEVHITYLDRHFTHKVPRCPQCGQVFFDEKLVEGRIRDLEFALEEK